MPHFAARTGFGLAVEMQGGVRLGGRVIDDVHFKITATDLPSGSAELSRGKKHKRNLTLVP